MAETVYKTPFGGEIAIAVRHLLLPPEDPEAEARTRRLRELGIEDRVVPEYDEFARELAQRVGGCYAGVNFFVDVNRQYFAGLYSAASDTTVNLESPLLEDPVPGRVMPRDFDIGFCPHVVRRRKALALEDVRDYPRFAGNHVVDAIGIHSYLGAPLIDSTGMALGTICVVNQDPHPWGEQGLEIIKEMAADLVERIERRAQGS
ncbi:GAF domain-containing protein [Streptomyces sp. NA02950]|uniref:GAF domain-containing protein n=1 Tax=Streptomyces sp. NA02950 TaxID=2742137 RepID=UPI0015904175|nr:GAF domain-containing protein [Streptomyces sp. NA02950]QKV96104.1 GAF domain-containing protein [Streptomyces sp. NA02950]